MTHVIRALGLLLVTVFLTVQQNAYAHGVADPRLKVSISTTEVRIETTLPATTLPDFPTSEDGSFSAITLKTHYERLANWVDQKLRLETATPSSITFSDLVPVQSHHEDEPLTHVRILRRYAYENAQTLTIRFCLLDDDKTVLLQQTGSIDEWSQVTVDRCQ